jgi:alpha-L-fucosidase
MPDADVARLREFGDAIRRIYSTDLAPGKTVWTPPTELHTATAEVDFRVPVRVDRTVLAEWIHLGQRVQRYDIQTWDGSRWETVHEATTIGHKKVDIFPPTTAIRMRVRILQATDTPRIRAFQVFDGSR